LRELHLDKKQQQQASNNKNVLILYSRTLHTNDEKLNDKRSVTNVGSFFYFIRFVVCSLFHFIRKIYIFFSQTIETFSTTALLLVLFLLLHALNETFSIFQKQKLYPEIYSLCVRCILLFPFLLHFLTNMKNTTTSCT